MAKAKVATKVAIVIETTVEEAEWLQEYLRNNMVGTESLVQGRIREALFNALINPLSSLNPGDS